MSLVLSSEKSGSSFPFYDFLYRAVCGSCQESLEWEAHFDADGTDHMAVCCGQVYSIFPDTFQLTIEEEES